MFVRVVRKSLSMFWLAIVLTSVLFFIYYYCIYAFSSFHYDLRAPFAVYLNLPSPSIVIFDTRYRPAM